MSQANIPCAVGSIFCNISKTMRWHIATPSRRLPAKTCHRQLLRSYGYRIFGDTHFLLTNNGLYGYANYFKVEGDSITVSGRGEVGHAIARHCKYVPIVRLLSLVPKYEDDVDFFAHIINATSIYIESTGVPQLTSPQLGAVKVLRPPIWEQKRISSLLLKIDVKIENEEHLTLYLAKIRSSMLQQLFI